MGGGGPGGRKAWGQGPSFPRLSSPPLPSLLTLPVIKVPAHFPPGESPWIRVTVGSGVARKDSQSPPAPRHVSGSRTRHAGLQRQPCAKEPPAEAVPNLPSLGCQEAGPVPSPTETENWLASGSQCTGLYEWPPTPGWRPRLSKGTEHPTTSDKPSRPAAPSLPPRLPPRGA